MKAIDLLKLSTRMFRTRFLRTFLTIFGVGVGIGAILFLVSLGYGLQRLILQQITTADSLLSLDVMPANEELIPLDKESLESISSIPNVQEIHPLAAFSGQITLNALTSDIVLYGVDSAYFRFGRVETQQGRLFDNSAVREVVISSALVKSFGLDLAQVENQEANFTLFIKEADPDANVKIEEFSESYKVMGVIEDDFSGFAYIPLRAIEGEGVLIQKYSQAKVKVSETKYMEEIRGRIIEMGFMVSALAETVDEANKVFTVIRIILAVFGLIALFISAIGMANTMTVTLLERTNEIGIMKSIGASNKDIGLMFLMESLVMGFLGGVGGIGIGFVGTEIFNGILNLVARGFGGQSIDLFYTPPWFLAFVMVFSTFVGFATGIFPARRAAKMNPLQALRYK